MKNDQEEFLNYLKNYDNYTIILIINTNIVEEIKNYQMQSY